MTPLRALRIVAGFSLFLIAFVFGRMADVCDEAAGGLFRLADRVLP